MKKMQEHAVAQESQAAACRALIEKTASSMLRQKEGGLTAIFCAHAVA